MHTQAHKCGFSVLIGILTGADVYVLMSSAARTEVFWKAAVVAAHSMWLCVRDVCVDLGSFKSESWWREGIGELHVVWVRTSNLGQRLAVENASHIMDWIKRRHACATNYCVYGIYLAACSDRFIWKKCKSIMISNQLIYRIFFWKSHISISPFYLFQMIWMEITLRRTGLIENVTRKSRATACWSLQWFVLFAVLSHKLRFHYRFSTKLKRYIEIPVTLIIVMPAVPLHHAR